MTHIKIYLREAGFLAVESFDLERKGGGQGDWILEN